MAAYLREITQNDFVFEDTIVAYMHANHNQIGIAYFREGVVMHTRMNSDLLADGIVVADYQPADFGVGAKTQYLGLAAYYAIGKQVIAFSYDNVFADNDVGFEDGPLAN
jgi:hypothetical protein